MPPPQILGAGCRIAKKTTAVDNKGYETGNYAEEAAVPVVIFKTFVAVAHSPP